MIHRQTSIEVYHKIKTNGLLPAKRLQVYDWLFHHGPATAGEVTHALKGPNEVHPSYHRRLDELGEQGVAYRTQFRKCSITGEEVTEWDVTAELPRKFTAPKSDSLSIADMAEAVESLRRIYSDLMDVRAYLTKLRTEGTELEPWMERVLRRPEIFPPPLIKLIEWVKKKVTPKAVAA